MAKMNVKIRMIRKNGNPTNDDLVMIDSVGPNQFRMKYTYGDTEKKVPYQIILDDRMLLRWMRIVIRLLEKDSDPFASLQLDFPTMPSVIFDVDALDDAYNTILDAIEFHIDNWPQPRPQEEEYEVHSPNPYEDMPSLVPAGDHTHRHLFM
jgi:hypothetical protein